MFSRDELLAQARRRYAEFLRAVVGGAPFFPVDLRIGKTRRAESYAERAAELAEFRAAAVALGVTVEWRMVSDPRFGPHERPERAFFANEAAFLSALGRTEEARCFRADLGLIRAECPALETWLSANALAVIQHQGLWPALMRVVAWFSANPRSGLYLRQIPVKGVDTKFFEQRKGILHALLLQTQPEAIDLTMKEFEARHGLRWEQPLVRVRFLDPTLQAAHGFPVADLAIPAPTFRALPLHGVQAIVTENLRNFLALPPLPNAVVVMGSGDAAALLVGAAWLEQARILYWGDMDARGFAILARLRSTYPAAESVMMDLATLERHRDFALKVTPYRSEITGLTSAEAAALERLGSEGLWLEQERVPFETVVDLFARRLTSSFIPAGGAESFYESGGRGGSAVNVYCPPEYTADEKG